MTSRYYVRKADGADHHLYYLLAGKTVVDIQASRPEGQEVSRPANVDFRLPDRSGASVPVPPRVNGGHMRPLSRRSAELQAQAVNPLPRRVRKDSGQ